ncbi:hypothetical protein C0585_01540 [Candidatus Woesearchaeota archaeon]|nr:MAG: hypothetical protein C0585_01540 [Candidatus Woesearchaeota archaeon]
MRRKFDLVCFDLDGTLIADDNGLVIWERILMRIYGNLDVSNQRYKDYKSGKFSFEEWVNIDLSDWKNNAITKEVLIEEIKTLKLNPGAKELVFDLKNEGFKLAVISGSIDFVLEIIFPDHPFEDVFINKIYFDDKGNISHWHASEYGDKGKADALMLIAKRENIPLEKVAYVGDHANDVSAAKIAGFSFGYNSKSAELDSIVDVNIKDVDMREIYSYLVEKDD